VDLSEKYGAAKTPAEADVIVSLGGDGQALRALQTGIKFNRPVFGLNFGNVGFLQNLHHPNANLFNRIARAEPITLSPLKFTAYFRDGSIRSDFAINEIHICNHNRAEGIY
jgi:NAD+ kinase